MSIFTSPREKKFWLCGLAVVVAILSTLFIGQPLAELFGNQNIQAIIFVIGMILVGTAIIIHSIKTKPGKFEMVILLGIVAVYVMLILRLGLPERSHLFEYSIFAIFIHKALIERELREKLTFNPSLLALVISFLIGLADECIQIFLPDRVFDINDIIFNGFAVSLAIGTSVVYSWVRKRFSGPKTK